MIGVELVDPETAPDALGARPPAPGLARAVRRACLDRGVIIELGGRRDAVLRLMPPLVLSDDHADRVVAVVADALTAASAAGAQPDPA